MSVKLGYWNIRGLASQIRYLMVYLGVDFSEDKYEQGPAPEFSRAAWDTVKDKLELERPSLPYLIDGNVRITDSIPIMKYICSAHNGIELLGRDPVEMGQVEMLAAAVFDLKGAISLQCYTTGDKLMCANIIRDKIEPLVGYLADKPFLIGDQVTYVDFMFYELLDFCGFLTEGKLFQQYGFLKDFMLRMSSLPRFSEFWKDSTRCIKRPFNNKIAKINN